VRVVLDDEQGRVALLDLVAIVGHLLLALRRQHRARDRFGGGTRLRLDAVGPGVVQRQVERERAALARHARELDLAAEQCRQLAADGEAEPGATVLARRAGIGLLERLEDQALLLRRHTDAGVLDGERHHRGGVAQHRVIHRPAVGGQADAQFHVTLRRELHGVREQVLQDLLQALRVGVDRARQIERRLDAERQVLGLGHVPEAAIEVVEHAAERDRLDVHRHRARFDLRQVENVVDQVEEVGPG
jgi:hypothetical protein